MTLLQPSSLESPTGEPSPAPGDVRAWIGLLVFAALAFVGFPAQNRLLRAAIPGVGSIELYVIGHVAQLAEILLFAWAAAILERRSFAAYGLPWRIALRARFWQGALAGITALTVLVLALVALGGLELAMPSGQTAIAGLIGAGYFALFTLLCLREEFLYRGYALSTLRSKLGFLPAAGITSIWFVSSHMSNEGESAIGLWVVGLFGLFACMLLLRTGNLWMPIGYHTAWNWGQTFLFGVGDSGHAAAPGHFFTATIPQRAPAWLSGGSTGPEGSALCLVLVALLVGATWWARGSRIWGG